MRPDHEDAKNTKSLEEAHSLRVFVPSRLMTCADRYAGPVSPDCNSSLFWIAARSVRRVSRDGAHRDKLCHPLRAWSPLSAPGGGSSRFAIFIASATADGTTALATTASFAGQPTTSSASPQRQASTI